MGVFPNDHWRFTTSEKIKLVCKFGLEYLQNDYNFKIPILKEYIKGAVVYFYEPLLRPKGVDFLGFYDYIYWNEEQILSTIINELDWKGASDTTATWRIDDASYPLMNYLYLSIVGFTEHDELYSKMIREGQISREEALKKCMNDHKPRIPTLKTTFEELEVSKEEIDDAVDKYRKNFLPTILERHHGDIQIV